MIVKAAPLKLTPVAAMRAWSSATGEGDVCLLLSDSPERLLKNHLPNAALSRAKGVFDETGEARFRVYLWHLNETGSAITIGIEALGADIKEARRLAVSHPNYFKIGIDLAQAHLFGSGLEPGLLKFNLAKGKLLGAVCELALEGEPGADFALQTYCSKTGASPGWETAVADTDAHPRGAWPYADAVMVYVEPLDLTHPTEFGICERDAVEQAIFAAETSSLHDGPSKGNRGLWGVNAEYRLSLDNPTNKPLEAVVEILARNNGGVFHAAIEVQPSGLRAIFSPIEHGKKNAIRLSLGRVEPSSTLQASLRIAIGGASTLPAAMRIYGRKADWHSRPNSAKTP